MTSFKLNHAEAFRGLWADGAFTDVFLTGGQNMIPAHRVILSSCSKYFKRVLSHTSQTSVTNYCVLDGISEELLAVVVQFVYSGVADVAPDKVQDFVQLCHKLEILGFEDADTEYDVCDTFSPDDSIAVSHL
jgi:hypothetical protein